MQACFFKLCLKDCLKIFSHKINLIRRCLDLTKKPQMIQKEEQVTQLEAWLKENTAVVLADYRGLTVAEDTALRSELRKNDIGYHVAKNTLIKRAANNLEITALDEYLNGPTALA